MKRSFLEGLFKDLEAEDSVKKSIIDSVMTENRNDLNVEKTRINSITGKLSNINFSFYFAKTLLIICVLCYTNFNS